MSENKAKDLTETVFSFLSIKVKMIIIGVCLGLFIIFIGVFALIGIFSNNSSTNLDDEEKGGSSGSVAIAENPYKYTGAKFNMPFEVWDSTRDVITSKFSPKRTITVNGVTQTRPHTGIDLVVVSKSSPKICSALSGKVIVATAGSTGYGNYVVLEHNLEDGTKIYTLYGHMIHNSIQVAVGDEVAQGQILGTMGSTGNSTGSHLHFEVRIGENLSSKTVDPFPYLFGTA